MLDAWREAVTAAPAFYIGWGGLLIGMVFGYIVFRTNFCAMGSISDFMSFGNFNRFRAWMLATGTAVAGVLVLSRLGAINPADAMYLSPSFGWLGNIVGGLMFGIGMVFAGGCMSRNLVRAGGGDLRSLLIIVVAGLAAYATIRGLLGPLRLLIFGSVAVDLTQLGMETQGMDAFLSRLTGIAPGTANLLVALVLAGGIAIYCFKSPEFRKSGRNIVAGFGIGLTVTAGWLLTGLAQDEFADVPVQLISLTYVRPSGDTLFYVMNSTAFAYPSFAVVTTFGAILGAFLGALVHRRFNLATFNGVPDTVRNLFGAVLMGTGGVIALGCTVGQGITGMSTLALGSVIALVSIIIGGMLGMKIMEAVA